MAKLADARDSKSREAYVSCGFDSHLRHQTLRNLDGPFPTERPGSAKTPPPVPGPVTVTVRTTVVGSTTSPSASWSRRWSRAAGRASAWPSRDELADGLRRLVQAPTSLASSVVAIALPRAAWRAGAPPGGGRSSYLPAVSFVFTLSGQLYMTLMWVTPRKITERAARQRSRCRSRSATHRLHHGAGRRHSCRTRSTARPTRAR